MRRPEKQIVTWPDAITAFSGGLPGPDAVPDFARKASLRSVLERLSWRSALGSTGLVGLAACLGGAVRLLPWLLDPSVTFRLATPFARGLAELACEAALVVGWPVGWALGTARFVERGEARAFATLGESPERTILRLAPQGMVFACALAGVSFMGGREASDPGRVVTDLIAVGREACAGVAADGTYVIPFTGAAWLCSPDAPPHIVGRAPGTLSGAMFTARDARTSGDLREINLFDAHLALGSARIQAGALRIRGLSPFAHASRIPPFARALALVLAAALASSLTALRILRGSVQGRFAALSTAATGALAALGAMRAVERGDSPWGFAVAVPTCALVAVVLISEVFSRLRQRMRAASR